jgi:two-component system, NarL family, response regulator LiaR
MPERIRILLVDDHAVVREGLRAFLELQEEFEVVGEAGDGAEGVREAERVRPDVILMDLVMPGLDGVDAMRALRESLPEARVIVLTSFSEDDRLLPAIQAGAAGYLLKDTQPTELARAVRAAHAGEAVLDPAVALELIAKGRPNKLIARELEISEKTVKAHVGRVLEKLGVSDRTQAALYAVRAGIVRDEPL